MGLEPTQPCGHWILSPARLPFRHSGQSIMQTQFAVARAGRQGPSGYGVCRRAFDKLSRRFSSVASRPINRRGVNSGYDTRSLRRTDRVYQCFASSRRHRLCEWRSSRHNFFVVKVSPEVVAIPERKAWTNRRLVRGIVTRLLPAPCNFSCWARRARKKISDRWNNVCARRSENVGFWRGHCSTIVPCTRGAAHHREFVS